MGIGHDQILDATETVGLDGSDIPPVPRNRRCPAHGGELRGKPTPCGRRYSCDVPGCTVAWWGREGTSPADAETRRLRKQCHDVFDPLWYLGQTFTVLAKGEPKRMKFTSRNAAYDWIGRVMGTKRKETHIGLFSAAQCRKLLAILEGCSHAVR